MCPKCHDMGFFRRDIDPGHPDFGKPARCDHPSHQPELLARLEAVSGLCGSDLDIRLDQIERNPGNVAMLSACQQLLDDRRGWLYVHGGPGNAKTVALMAMVNQINAAGQGPAMYIKFSGLLDYMRDSFREKAVRDNQPDATLGYVDRFNKILAVPFLAIDELDKIRKTGFADEFRFDFLDERYRQALRGDTVTVFASNEPPDSLPGAICDRIYDGRFRVVQNLTPSARPAMTWQAVQ